MVHIPCPIRLSEDITTDRSRFTRHIVEGFIYREAVNAPTDFLLPSNQFDQLVQPVIDGSAAGLGRLRVSGA